MSHRYCAIAAWLLSAGLTTSVAAEVCGDVDFDGTANASDLQQIRTHLSTPGGLLSNEVLLIVRP